MDLIDDIRKDRRSGASELALRSLYTFIALVQEKREKDAEDERERLRTIARKLAGAQPSMASLHTCMNSLFPIEGRTGEEVRRTALARARREMTRIAQFEERISRHGARLIKRGQTILTLSASSSVMGILKKASTKGISVIVCESHPGGEGRECANFLSAFSRTTLIPDFSVSHFMREVNLVLVGADAVCLTHLINKCGTRLVVREANINTVPVACACDTNKIIGSKLPIREFSKREGPILKRKVLFDRTPLREITSFVTEHGVCEPSDIIRLAKERGKHTPSI